MKTKILNCLMFSLTLTAAFAADALSLSEWEAKIERASHSGNAGAVAAQLTELEQALAATPADPALNYFRALAYYTEGSLARVKNDKASLIANLEAAAKKLEPLKTGPWAAEAIAFQGYIFNQLIGAKGGAVAMTLGPKSSSLLAKAAALAPGNPRVLFFQGVSLATTPEMFGGDLPAAIKLLEKADVAFVQQSADAAVHWGHAEALAWLGLAKKKNGDLVGTRAAWERALAVDPDYGWIKYVLMPSLEKAPAKSSK